MLGRRPATAACGRGREQDVLVLGRDEHPVVGGAEDRVASPRGGTRGRSAAAARISVIEEVVVVVAQPERSRSGPLHRIVVLDVSCERTLPAVRAGNLKQLTRPESGRTAPGSGCTPSAPGSLKLGVRDPERELLPDRETASTWTPTFSSLTPAAFETASVDPLVLEANGSGQPHGRVERPSEYSVSRLSRAVDLRLRATSPLEQLLVAEVRDSSRVERRVWSCPASSCEGRFVTSRCVVPALPVKRHVARAVRRDRSSLRKPADRVADDCESCRTKPGRGTGRTASRRHDSRTTRSSRFPSQRRPNPRCGLE